MTEKDKELALKVLTEFLNSLNMASAQALADIGVAKVEWNPDALKWIEAEGTKGPYQRCNDVDNPDFQWLMKDLDGHGGTLTRDGWFYWSFSRGDAVGRKRSKAKK